MLAGRGTNRFVRASAAQSIVLWGTYLAAHLAFGLLGTIVPLFSFVDLAIDVLWLGLWVYTFVSGFQGRPIDLPVVTPVARRLFAAALT